MSDDEMTSFERIIRSQRNEEIHPFRKDHFVEFLLAEFARLETEYSEALQFGRESTLWITQGQMMAVAKIYERVTGEDYFLTRIHKVLKRQPL